ncbi:MAG: sialidase family protein [Verrucomicrobiales bacterium]|jgi:sialidase-1
MKRIGAILLLGMLEVAGFKLSADWGGSRPVFQASLDEVDGHQYACFREPVVVRTKSGRIVIGIQAGNRHAWPERSGQDLVVRFSDDDGKSWSGLIVAAEAGDFSCQCHGLAYDAEINRLFFLYTTYNWDYKAVGKGRGAKYTAPIYEKMAKGGKPFVTSYRVYSDDEGRTWSKPEDITEMVGRQAHFGASEGRQLTLGRNKGRLLLPGSRMDLNEKGEIIKKHIGVWRSDDHGKTWTLGEVPVPEGINTPRNISSEARVTELSDGTLLYNDRTRNTGRQLSWSMDGGVMWNELVQGSELKVTQCNGSLLTLRDEKGALTNTVLFSVPSAGGRSNGLVYVSHDDGRTWPVVKNVVIGSFAYSALLQLKNGRVGLFHETGHYRTISLVELDLEQLLEE